MVALLRQKFARLYNKLKNHEAEELSASLMAFRSQVSKLIHELASNLKPGSETLSLFWIIKCLGILPLINKAFRKLTLEIDYPMSRWDADSRFAYIRYHLCMQDFFISISSSLSHFEEAKLSLTHALKVFENSPSSTTSYHHHHLKAIESSCFDTKYSELFFVKDDNGKELVVNKGMKELKSIGFWVCGILLSGLCGDVKPYIKVKMMVGGFDGSLIFTVDSIIREGLGEKNFMLKEVKEVNDAVDCFLEASDEVKHDAAKELETKLNKFVVAFDVVKANVKDVKDLFIYL